MASLKSQEVVLPLPGGDKTVKAVTLGSWAVHKAFRGSGFTVTHIPSGMAAFTAKTKKSALGALEAISQEPSLLNAKTVNDVMRHKALMRELVQSTSGRKTTTVSYTHLTLPTN